MPKHTSTDKATKSLSYPMLSAFCEELALLLHGGTALLEGFYILLEESEDEQGRGLYRAIIATMEEGGSLSEALERSAHFPSYLLHMVKIGERSGRLEEVFRALSTYYLREDELRRFIRHALGYPLAMVAMMLLVIGVLMVEVMPVFRDVFLQLGGEMSGFAQQFLLLGLWFSDHAAVIVVAVLVLVALLFVLFRKGSAFSAGLRETFFLTKPLYRSVAVARFASGMSLMLSSGLDTDESLRLVQDLVEHRELSGKIQTMRQDMEEGKPFAETMREQRVFTGIHAHMLAVGFTTGSIDEVMHSLAERCSEEVSGRFEKLVSVIEPSIVAILSIVIGGILLSVMLPLMSIISQMG